MDGVLLDRRGVLALGAASVLAPAGAKAGAVDAATVDILRVCNTDYYPAAKRLFDLAPGRMLEVRFDHDPAFVDQPSAGLWLDGEKVGDAPRRSRGWLGRMLDAGRRLSAQVETIRPESRYSGPAGLARIDLTPQADAAPMTLGEGYVCNPDGRRAPGEWLRLALEPPPRGRGEIVVCRTAAGESAGRLHIDQDRVARHMIEAGLPIAAEVREARGVNSTWNGVRLWLAR